LINDTDFLGKLAWWKRGVDCGHKISVSVKMVSLKNLSIFVKYKMVSHYIIKTELCMYPDGYILKSVKEVVAGKKVCVVSKETSIPKRSLGTEIC
jgi:hypothetical protein